MKNIKKYMKFLLVVLVAFAIRTANVYAATKHQYSFKAYTCDEIEELDSGGYGCTTDPVAVTNTTGSFLPGKILQLDLWYKPGDDPCTMMQVGINYDNTKLEAIMDGEYAIQAGPILSTAKGGIYPTKTATSKLTNWQFDSNVYQNRQVLFLIEDKMLEQPLTNEGTLVSVFFRVKDNAVAGESFSFTYDEGYTLLNTEAPFQTTPASYKIYQQVDSDTTITAVNVVSGSTTYPTKEAISNTRNTYTVYVPNSVSSVNVSAIPTKTTTTVTSANNQSLTVGTTKTVELTATAQSLDTKKYYINVYRLNNDNTLSNLTLSGINYGTFNKNTTNYTVTVPYTTTSTSVSATTTDTKATLSGTGTKDLVVGDNTISVEVTPENCKSDYTSVPGNTCTKKTYTVTVKRQAASTNASLSDLKVDGVTVPNFDPDTLEYTLPGVANNKSSVNVTYVKADETSTVTGDGTRTLAVGDNQLKVTVTAQDGTTKKEYKINIRRVSNDSTLKSLTISSNPSGTLNPTTFSALTTEYTYTVGPDVTAVTIAAVKNHNMATLENTGGTYNPQTTSKVEFLVVAEDNSSTKYTVNLARTKSNNANLSSLSVTGYTLNPSTFNANTTSYTLIVPPTVSSINVNATLADTKATKTGDTTYNLTVGSNNTSTVHVVAENGTTTKDYVITTTRLSGENRLNSLTLSGINYGTFDKDTINYSVTVPYTTTSTSVSATTLDTKATKTGTGNKTLVVGLNQIEVEVSPENCKSTYSTVPNNTCTKKTYTVNVTREAASTNASLSDLKVDGVTVPGFSEDTLEYTLPSVANNKSSVEVTYTKSDETSIVTGDGTKTLTVGDNELKVTVTAQDGTTKKEYKINIRRKSNDATLKSLTVTSNPAGVLSETFNPSTLEYTYTVNSTVSEITVNGVKNHESASVVSGNGTYNLSESTFANILVRAEDSTELTYKVNFVKSLGINANLSSLSVVGYTISPEFDKDTTAYTLTVPTGIDSVEIAATPEDPNGSVENVGNKALNYGENTFTINGVAENGTTKKPYSVKITRTKKNIATLSDIKVNGVSIEGFDPNVTEYTLDDVTNDVGSINITATLTDPDATVDGTGDIPLGVGDNEITLLVTAQDGTQQPYTIHVNRENDDEYITSIQYGHVIEDGMIKTVAYKTKPEQLKDQLDNDNEKLEIWDKDETSIISEDTNLGTGMIVKLIVNGKEKDRKTIVVKGDVDGNGEIALLDAVLVLNHYLEKTLLTGVYLEAADTNTDGEAALLDAVNILKIYLSE